LKPRNVTCRNRSPHARSQAYEQAYSLQQAQQQSSIYSQPIAASAANPQQDKGLYDQRTVTTTQDTLTKSPNTPAALQPEHYIASMAVAYLGFPAPGDKVGVGVPTQHVRGSIEAKSELEVKGSQNLTRTRHIFVSRPV